MQTNYGNDIDIYYGGSSVCSDKDIDISVNLYRQMCNFEIDVENLTEGEIILVCNFDYQTVVENNGYIYSCNKDNPKIDVVVELPNMPWDWGGVELEPGVTATEFTEDCYKYWKSSGGVNIYYKDTDNEITQLTSFGDFKRMTKYKMTLDMNKYIDVIKGNVDGTVVNDEWVIEIIND